jgi:hypothetical protein
MNYSLSHVTYALILVLFLFVNSAAMALSDEEIAKISERRESLVKAVCGATIQDAKANHLQFALSALWLNERTKEANQRLRDWFATGHRTDEPIELLLQKPDEYAEQLATALSGLKWSARTWIRIYYLFNKDSKFFPGRLEADVEKKLQELFWALANEKSTVKRSQLKYIWAIQGSENHDMMDLSNAFMTLQVLKDLPDYRDRKLADGHLPKEHYAAWNRYYIEYCRERALHGLFVELSSPIYGKHFLGELFNIHDFAEDLALRKNMKMLLDVTWADWASDQLGGVRGGGRTRSYFGHYSQRGTSDSWLRMSDYLLGRTAPETFPSTAQHGQVEYVIATSEYRLPDVVVDIALDQAGRGAYVYRSLRPARMLRATEVKDSPPLLDGTWYHMDPKDPRMVRYSYCTPDYIMGSLWVDPSFTTTFRLEPGDVAGEEHYAAINSQSRWQGIVFSTGPNSRVFPQCVGLTSENRVNYHQHVTVQHENVMLVQKCRKSGSAGAMRVFFAPEMKAKLVEEDNHLFLREGDAYLAVIILPGLPDSETHGYRWESENWVFLSDEYAPVVFVASRTEQHRDLKDFIEYVKAHQYEISDGKLTYSFQERSGKQVSLGLYLEVENRLPEINGKPIDLKPDYVYDGPFLSLKSGSSVIEIRKGDRKLTYDLSKSL